MLLVKQPLQHHQVGKLEVVQGKRNGLEGYGQVKSRLLLICKASKRIRPTINVCVEYERGGNEESEKIRRNQKREAKGLGKRRREKERKKKEKMRKEKQEKERKKKNKTKTNSLQRGSRFGPISPFLLTATGLAALKLGGTADIA